MRNVHTYIHSDFIRSKNITFDINPVPKRGKHWYTQRRLALNPNMTKWDLLLTLY